MVSSGVRQGQRFGAALLALVAIAAPGGAAVAQRGDYAERQQQLISAIQEIVSREGLNAPGLLEPLTALIVLYEEEEDDALAVVAIERARHVVRVNNGLHTLEQVPYIRQLIRIEEARGNHVAAWDLEQGLLELVRRFPDDLRTVPVLREAADKRMSVLAAYLAGEKPAQLYLGCYYKPAPDVGDCHWGSRGRAVQGMVADAQRKYSEAIAVLLRNEQYDSGELRELELALLRGVDLIRTRNSFDDPRASSFIAGNPMSEHWRGRTGPIVELAGWDLPYFNSGSSTAEERRRVETNPFHVHDTYHRGRQSLSRLYAYDVASSSPLLSQANDLLQMADWELLHSNNGVAVRSYELVRGALQRAGVAEASIDEIFLPQVPTVLPAFQPNPLARDETRGATGHIDVAFDITKYGRGRAVEILGTANATRDSQDRLVRLIAHSRFRPRPTEGAFEGASRVAVRYYVYDGASRSAND